jgi:hypothetical protein
MSNDATAPPLYPALDEEKKPAAAAENEDPAAEGIALVVRAAV